MRLQSFQSGSNGNAVYIGSESTHLLLDAGISCKRITEALHGTGLVPQDLNGILITHEHSDHVSGLFVLAKKYGIPVYGSEGTLAAVREIDKAGCIREEQYRVIEKGVPFSIGDLTVNTIGTSHDARDPVAYRIDDGRKSMAVMTDLGTFTEDTVRFLSGVNGLLLESNHDVRMLETGPYPYVLKRRILGDFGHLSNMACGTLLNRILDPGLEFVFLGHLSEENNYPDIALLTVTQSVDMAENEYHSSDFNIRIASRHHASELVSI
ncbi:MAG: MBL fold metallo-hydrolase [Lachnospiraceae bacterium]|nr:MBL fold metallo-hydrolase [Lachnospiraceae bacterium]